MALPASTEVRPARTSLVFPLTGVRGDLLLAQVRSTESVGLAVEAQQGEAWIVLGSTTGRDPRLEVPHEGGKLRLRLWSLDRRDAGARLSVVSVAAPRSGEGALARGLRVTPIAGLSASTGAVLVEVDRPGLFRLAGAGTLRVATESGVACRPATNGLVAVGGKRLYLVADAPAEAVRAERVVLGRNGSLVVDVPSRGLVPVDVVPAGGPLLVRARSRTLQPGVWLGDATRVPVAGAMAVSSGLAQSVSLDPRRPLAVVFAAMPPAPGLGPIGEATLEAVALPKPQSRTLTAGITDVSLPGVSALSYALPEGAKRLRIALSRDGVAVLAKGSEVEAVVAADAEATAMTLDTTAPTLLLLQTAAGEGRISVEMLSAEATVLGEGRPAELSFAEAGERRLTVDATGPGTLRLRGAIEDATFVGQDGSVGRGRDVSITGPGTLLLRHSRGPVVAWLEREGESARRLWAAPEAGARTVWTSGGDPPRRARAARRRRDEGTGPAALPLRHTPGHRTRPQRRQRRGRRPLRSHEHRRVPSPGTFGAAAASRSRQEPLRHRRAPDDSPRLHRRGPGARGVAASRRLPRLLVPGGARRTRRPGRARQRRGGGGHAARYHGPSTGHGRDPDADTRARRVPPRPARAQRRTRHPRAPGRGRPRTALDRPAHGRGEALPRARGRRDPAFSSRYVEDLPEAALGYEEGEGREQAEPETYGDEEEEEEPPTGAEAGAGGGW